MGATRNLVYDFDRAWYVPCPTPAFHALFWVLVLLSGLLAGLALRRYPRLRLAAPVLALAILLGVEASLRLLAAQWPANFYGSVPGALWTLPASRQGITPALRTEAVLPRLDAGVSGTFAAPNPTEVVSNSLGMRERELPLDKPADELRIVCIGDSWVFGLGVPQDRVFTRQLEENLSRRFRSPRIRVISVGMPGATSLQGYLLLTQVGMKFHPDLVVNAGFNLAESHPALEDLDPLQAPVRTLLRKSMAYAVLRQEVLALASRDSPGAGSVDGLHYFQRIQDLLHASGVPLLTFNHVYHPTGTREEWIALPAEGPSWPEQRRIDLRPRTFVGPRPPFMQEADVNHPSEFGHAEIARVLAEYISQWGVVERLRPDARRAPLPGGTPPP